MLVAGYAGSGKTEFAKHLAPRTGWALLDKDTLTRPLVELAASTHCGDPHDRHTDAYLTQVRPFEYACLLATAWEVLDYGCSVIATGPFLSEVVSEEWTSDLAWRCKLEDIVLVVAWVHADLTLMRERLMRRGAKRDGWKLRNWDAYAAEVNTALRPAIDHVVIDNTGGALVSLADQADLLIQRLAGS